MIQRPSGRLALALLLAGAGLLAATPTMAQAPASAPAKPEPAHPNRPSAHRLQVLDPLTPTPPPAPLPITEADWRTPDPDNLLVIDTNHGRIVAELTPYSAPQTVERIKALARQHFYDGRSFFRVIDGFMAQTGDPKDDGSGGSTLPNVPGEFTFRRDHAEPFVSVATPEGAEEGLIGVLPVETQPDAVMALTQDGKATAWPLFCTGVLGFARSGSPDSGNSQFFLMRATYPSLEKRYAAFGRVISGQDAVKAIKTGEPVAAPQDVMTRVRLGDDLPPGEQLHVRVLDTTKGAFKVLLARLRDEKGADFSACDIVLPSQGP